MLRSTAARGLAPAVIVTVVLAAAFILPSRSLPFGSTPAASCYGYPTCAAPVVTGVTPTSGTTAGGTFVVITGVNFDNTSPSVAFGATAAASFTVVSDTRINAISPAHAAGTVDVRVTTIAGTSATSSADQYTFVALPPGNCTSVSISPANPVRAAGTTVGFTATSTGCPNPQYQFWIRFLNNKWYIKQAYSSDPTWSWNSSGFPPGLYRVVVWVRQLGHTAKWERYAVTSPRMTGCTTASLTPKSGSSVRGVPVVFTAAAGGGCPSPVFKFYIRDTKGHWHLVRAFSATNTWTWNNTGWGKGVYRIVVWANQANSYLGRPQKYAFSDRRIT